MKEIIKTISLFSGAGGLDTGAIQAGAKIIWANDIMPNACESYQKNIGKHIVCGNLNDYLDELRQMTDIDLVIGGPPCQGFSVAGKMDENDRRSLLVWSYANVISIVKPRAFIMENVKALAELERWSDIRNELLSRFKALGYSVDFIVLNASDFNVPQSRERVFFVGFKTDDECVNIDLQSMIRPYRKKSPTVREALQVLDHAGTGNNIELCKAQITIAKKPVFRQSPYAGMLFNGMGRPLNLDKYSATLPASMGGNKTPIVDENALYNGTKPWVELFHELVKNNGGKTKGLSLTVPSFLRRLTVKEAAVIQTFPLEYEFVGPQSSIFTQIGNAVPCNLANAVCKMVIDVLSCRKDIITKDEISSSDTIELNQYEMKKETKTQKMINGKNDSLDRNKATTLFTEAFDNASFIDDDFGKLIKKVLNSQVKTYGYIFVTAILAKATNDKINVYSMQLGDGTKGNYNARTFCKKVICTIESNEAPLGLGGSRDPFVSNPGRKGDASSTSHVKYPEEHKLLQEALGKIGNSENAKKYLPTVAFIIKENSESRKKAFDTSTIEVDISEELVQPQIIIDLISKLTERSMFGEICPIIVAAIESLYNPTYKIIAHVVNESGESSNEVGDIDIYDDNNAIVSAIEVKDKPFNEEDLIVALKHFHEAKLRHTMFVYGVSVSDKFDKDYVYQQASRYGRIGTYCAVLQILDYAKLRVYDMIGKITLRDFKTKLLEYAKMINAKQETTLFIRKLISNVK